MLFFLIIITLVLGFFLQELAFIKNPKWNLIFPLLVLTTMAFIMQTPNNLNFFHHYIWPILSGFFIGIGGWWFLKRKILERKIKKQEKEKRKKRKKRQKH